MTYSPMDVARSIGNNLGKIQTRQMDRQYIDEILQQANQPNQNPQQMQQNIAQMLTRISPENQQVVIKQLEGQQKQIAQQKQQQQLASQLFGDKGLQYAGLPLDVQLKAAQLQNTQQMSQEKQMLKQQQEQDKLLKDQRESQILAKQIRGEQLTPEEQASLSPTSQRTILGLEKPVFEPREEALEAERVSKLATEIETEYQGIKSENMRLDKMENLSDKDELSTPLMIATLNKLGLPIGILGNPDSEEHAKLEADFLRDVSKIFPGGKISNYEVQSYLKSIPSLLNTKEGRKAIIKNRRLMNEAKQLKYDAYKDIIKENKGRKPRNLGLLIEERIGGKLSEIENKFKGNIEESGSKFQVPIRMLDPQGRPVSIPPDKIQDALNAGAKFQ